MIQRAGFGIRTLALLIDTVVLVVLSVMCGLMAGGASSMLLHWLLPMDPRSAAASTTYSVLLGFGAAIAVGLIAFYLLSFPYNLMEALFGWTPGKLMTGLRVRDQSGNRASLGQMLGRWLLKHVGVLLALLSISTIPFVTLTPPAQAIIFFGCFMALGASRQALHDHATQTAVYEVSALEAAAAERGDMQRL